MTLQFHDTIAALASPPGPAARGIVRLSGPEVRTVLEGLFQPDDSHRWEQAGRAERHTGRLRFAAESSGGVSPPAAKQATTVALPAAIYLWLTDRSYTGQPSAEIHTVGSPPLLEALLAALFENGARPARPGEFTLRAFLAGRIDLVQAEAVLGVIDAHDHAELQTALSQLAGGISGRIAEVREDLLSLLADLEAGLDFADEDIEFVERRAVVERLGRARAAIDELLEQASERMLSTGRRRVVLAGLPNAGKSTLFNALAGRRAALVSDVSGTTRDYLSAELHWNSLAVELIDTAGWEAVDTGIAAHAQMLRDEQVEQADLVVWCTAADLSPLLAADDARLRARVAKHSRGLVIVRTKCDRPSPPPLPDAEPFDLMVSAPAGFGLIELKEAVAARLGEPGRNSRQLVGTTAARCRDSLRCAAAALDQALAAAETSAGEELLAFEIRDALEQLGQILGAVYTDDILDRIFSKFCIGK